MNKKILAVMGISGALLLGSVYSISANSSGYELYKTALKQTHEAKSATVSMNFALTDNGETIFSGDSVMKTDTTENVNSFSVNMATKNDSSTMNMNKQAGKWYVEKAGEDVVYEMDATSPHTEKATELQDDLENLIDVATKNLQQQITVDQLTDGRQTIELDLTGKEIPLTANAVSSLMVKHSVMLQDRYQQDEASFHLQPTIPELDHDITVKHVNISAVVNKQNYLEEQTVKIVVSGKEANGIAHELTFSFVIKAADYNKTKVFPVEINTDHIEKINMSHGHGRK